ncbi:MAG: hypothetical protein ACYC9L_15630 [Sulfuricaulis sp.]
MGRNTDRQNLHDRLAEFALRPDWPEHYANWYVAMERRGILRLINRLSLHVDDLRPAMVRRFYAERLRAMCVAHAAQRTVGYLEAAVTACAARIALDCGIPVALLTDESAGFQLTRDLGRILVWEARILAVQLLAKKWPNGTPTRADLASAVEHRMGKYICLTHEYLNYLERTVTALNLGDTG